MNVFNRNLYTRTVLEVLGSIKNKYMLFFFQIDFPFSFVRYISDFNNKTNIDAKIQHCRKVLKILSMN